MRRPLLALALSCALTTAAPRAFAEDAEAVIAHGVQLREQGKDEEALAEFRRAFGITPSAKAKAQMALAEQALGMWVPAEQHLNEALKVTNDPWIARNRGALTQSLHTVEQHLGTLAVRGGVDGADVLVDGAKIGTLPLPAMGTRVEAGRRNLEVRADGYYPISRIVVVPPGELTRETIELRPRPADEPPPPVATTPAPAPTTGTATPPPPVTSPDRGTTHEDAGNLQRTMGWVLLSAGAAFLATGVVGQLVRQGQISSYNDDSTCPGIGKPNQPTGCQSRIDSASSWQTISIVGFVAGGALATGGIVLVLTAPSSSRGTAGFTLRARF